MDTAERIGEIAANVAASASAEIAQIADGAAIQIENAEKRVESAEAVAQAVTDAALLSAIGQRVTDHQSEVQTWLAGLRQSLDNQDQRLTSMETQIMELMARPQVVVATTTAETPEAEASSILPQSAEPEVTTTLSVIDPALPGASVAVPLAPAPSQKTKRKWI